MAAKFDLNPNNFSFIKYIKLVAVIPLSWLNENIDRNQNQLYNFSSFKKKLKNQISILGKSNKTAYNFLKNRSTTRPAALKQQLKWCLDLELDNEDINCWSQIYESNYYSTNETKLRCFQIRLNLRSIVTNEQLHGFEMIDSDVRVFCLKKTETLLHLFCDSSIVDQFWNNVFDFISTKSGIDLICNSKHKLFEFQEKGNEFCFINGLLLCARFLIYRCKYSKIIPNMLQYFNLLNCMRASEHSIAKRNNKLTSHIRKWSFL